VFGLGEEQIFTGRNKTDLAGFFNEKRFNLNLNDGEILVELGKLKRNRYLPKVIVTPNISTYILINNFEKKVSLNLIKKLKSRNLLSNYSFKTPKQNILQIKKLIEINVWEYISANQLTATKIACTNSIINPLSIPIYINHKKIPTFLFWYSTNDLPFQKKGENKIHSQKLTHLNDFISINFAWNDFHKASLKERGLGNIKVTGSIIFREQIDTIHKNKGMRVLYFDVTPQDLPDNFYDTEMSLKNLMDLIYCRNELSLHKSQEISLILKQKRKYFRKHSKIYIQTLKNLSKSGEIQILKPFTNIYEEISKSEAVVVMPYSSPAQIAVELGVPTVYYCGLEGEWELGTKHSGVRVIKDRFKLQKFLEQCY
jgi:polysaccharide biosynthesis PFTS motif protein